jgi:hypothetical protein
MSLDSSLPNKTLNTNKKMNYISIVVPSVNGLQEVGGAPLRDWLNYWKLVNTDAKVYPEETIEVGEYVSSRKRGQRCQRPRANAYVPDSDDKIEQLIKAYANGYETPSVGESDDDV